MKFIPHRGNDKIESLRQVGLFANLPRKQLDLIAANLDETRVEAGQKLVQEGHRNDAFWVVLDGTAEMFVGDKKSHDIGPGDFFGATSMLDGKPAVGTVVSTSPMRALVASAAQFRALEGNDTIALRLMSYALERMREDLEAKRNSSG